MKSLWWWSRNIFCHKGSSWELCSLLSPRDVILATYHVTIVTCCHLGHWLLLSLLSFWQFTTFVACCYLGHRSLLLLLSFWQFITFVTCCNLGQWSLLSSWPSITFVTLAIYHFCHVWSSWPLSFWKFVTFVTFVTCGHLGYCQRAAVPSYGQSIPFSPQLCRTFLSFLS